MPLRVSANRRFLVRAGGPGRAPDREPFFYLGDTAWLIYHRLTREEVDHYLGDRAQKGFTVVQTSLLGEKLGLTEPNRYGHLALASRDPPRLNERYLEHVEYVLDAAAARGLYVAISPVWATHVVGAPDQPAALCFTAATARAYGECLGGRYRERANVIWLVGGDRLPLTDGYDHRGLWRALAHGLRRAGGGRHLLTFHPPGGAAHGRGRATGRGGRTRRSAAGGRLRPTR